MEDEVKNKNVNKLPDINYALMAQLVYLHWNNLKNIEEDITQRFL